MNGIILIDKPQGWTSHDVVGKLRGILHERRIGHSGTLDPLATGLLVVFIGRATRAVEFAEADRKEYIAGLRLGMSTDTQDITGRIISKETDIPDEPEVRIAIERFRGELEQTPPMYSAVKIGGKKLYELARKGESIERKPRHITIFGLEITGRSDNDYILDVVCSKGTYIRTLCHDIGAAMGCGGCMSSLRRTMAAGFTLADSVTLDAVLQADEPAALLLPVDAYFSGYPDLVADPEQEKRIRNGAALPMPGLPDGRYRVYGQDGTFLALSQGENGVLTTVKSFYEV